MFTRVSYLNQADSAITEGGGNIAHSVFHALMREFLRGKITAAKIETYFVISGGAVMDWDWLKLKYQTASNKAEFVEVLWDVMQLAEVRVPGYQTVVELKARIQAAV